MKAIMIGGQEHGTEVSLNYFIPRLGFLKIPSGVVDIDPDIAVLNTCFNEEVEYLFTYETKSGYLIFEESE